MNPFRRQLPVASPITAADLAAAALDMATHRDRSDEVRRAIAAYFSAREVLLTDSGTSALVLALRAVAKPGEIVAMPAYACVDLIAAAVRAEVRIRFFDIDPATLSPDIDSLRHVIANGVRAVVVAHLYGFAADMPAVMDAAREAGIPVVEDAAQHACATIGGRPAGSFGDLVVLSFGRGKGTTSGRGGALLVNSAAYTLSDIVPAAPPRTASAGDLVVAKASWLLGRPAIYGIPASIPQLHLGETVYHEAREPMGMSVAAVGLLRRTFADMQAVAAARCKVARSLAMAAEKSTRAGVVQSVRNAESGYLRFPMRLADGASDLPRLGITRAYPIVLPKDPHATQVIVGEAQPLNGAHDLAARLVTLPTHFMVTSGDVRQLSQWITGR